MDQGTDEPTAPRDGHDIIASRRVASTDPTIAVLERISRQLHSIRVMLIFFVWLSILGAVAGGIIWISAHSS